MIGTRRILFLSGSDKLADPAIHILLSSGHDVIRSRAPVEASTWLRIHRADLVVVDFDVEDPSGETGDLVARLREGAMRGGARLLVLTRGRGEARMRSLFERIRLSNFLAVGADEQLEPVELIATVSKIVSGDIFGIERYLAPGFEEKEFRIVGSRQKEATVKRSTRLPNGSVATPHGRIGGGRRRRAHQHAIYDAPVDQHGCPRFLSVDRTTPVELEPAEAIAFASHSTAGASACRRGIHSEA